MLNVKNKIKKLSNNNKSTNFKKSKNSQEF